MQVKVCKNCKRLFKYIFGPDLCPDCRNLMAQEKDGQKDQNEGQTSQSSLDNPNTQSVQSTPNKKGVNLGIRTMVRDEEAKFDLVRDYIMTNPKASVAQIAEAFDVSPLKLFEWVREERLEFSDDSLYAWFSCELCGTKIKSGRLCSRCKKK